MKIRVMGLALLLAGISVGVSAQGGRASRDILQRAAASVGDCDVVTAIHVYKGSVTEANHTHPGDLSGYVLEGSITLTRAGQSPVTLNAGQTFFVPSGVAHHVASAGNARLVATYIVEKGKPLATGAN